MSPGTYPALLLGSALALAFDAFDDDDDGGPKVVGRSRFITPAIGCKFPVSDSLLAGGGPVRADALEGCPRSVSAFLLAALVRVTSPGITPLPDLSAM